MKREYTELSPLPKFDILKLQEHFKTVIEPLKPYLTTPAWGGWGVWTGTGRWQAGFEQNGTLFASGYEIKGAVHDEDLIGFQKRSPKAIPARKHIIPTEVCTGYLAEVMNSIRDAGLYPCRARISTLRAGGTSTWHRDIDKEHYMVRLHIPLFSNEKALFLVEDEDTQERIGAHLPADGSSYFCSTNCLHRVSNDGDDERIHLFMDVTDLHEISKHHGVKAFKQWCEERSIEAQFRPTPDYTQITSSMA